MITTKSKTTPRQEINRKIKEYGLREVVKERWGSDYTRVSSERLQMVIDDYEKKYGISKRQSQPKLEEINPSKIDATKLKKAFIKLVTILQTTETLLPEEVEEILQEF